MKITTILPVSRIQYLDRVLQSLLNQTIQTKNLIVVFDGPDSEYLAVRNKIVELDIENKICIKSNHSRQAFSIYERRWHIVDIHNQIREIIGDCDWVFSIEDDGILPKDSLERLLATANTQENVGMVTGVELGRWGIPYVGAWRADNVENCKQLTSLENKTSSSVEVEEIDACGLYCALIKPELYKEHQFDTRNGLGPDVNLGLYIRNQGFKNYINWGVHVTHMTFRHGKEIEIHPTDESKTVTLTYLSGSTWKT